MRNGFNDHPTLIGIVRRISKHFSGGIGLKDSLHFHIQVDAKVEEFNPPNIFNVKFLNNIEVE